MMKLRKEDHIITYNQVTGRMIALEILLKRGLSCDDEREINETIHHH